jgi:N,N'-diacetylchitobiose transport system substrate-binding protein
MQVRKSITWGAALAAASLALSACAGGGPGPSTGDGSLTVWMMTGGPGENPVIEEAISALKQEHPEAEVKVEIQQWDEIVTRLTTALASDDPPDIVEMGNTQTPLFTYSGALAQLDPAGFERSDEWLEGLSALTTYDGNTYAAPLYGGTKIVMYNRAKFAEAGISEPPTTLDELLADCDALAAANADVPNFSPLYMPGEYWFAGVPFLFGKGGELATQIDGQWTAQMSSPENIAGLQAWRAFQNRCSPVPSSRTANTDSPDQDRIFADRNSAMIYMRAWERGAVLEMDPSLEPDLGYFIMPGYTEGAPLPVIIAGSTIGVAQNSPNQELATDFLHILTSESFQKSMTSAINQLPIVPGFLPADAPEHIRLGAQAATVSRPVPSSPGQATLENEQFNEKFFARIASGDDPVAAAAAYDTHATETLNALGD